MRGMIMLEDALLCLKNGVVRAELADAGREMTKE